jgi:ELWxxDGT repeat protein
MRLSHIALCLVLLPGSAFALGNDSMRGPFVVSGKLAYFPAASRADVLELWTTDGTPAGTRRVADLGGGNVVAMVPMNEGVAFLVSNQQQLTLWRANGTEAVQVAGLGRALTAVAFVLNGQLLFSIDRPTAEPGRASPHELWRSDGTAEGTAIITTIPQQARNGAVAGNLLYMVLGYREQSRVGRLWRTDGTADGTWSTAWETNGQMAQAGASLLFGGAPDGLWRTTDGSVGTTEFVASDRVPEIVTAGSRAYFAVQQTVWRSDGTLSGTAPVWSAPKQGIGGLIPAGDDLYFASGPDYLFYEAATAQVTRAGFATPVAAAAGGRFFFGWPSYDGSFFVSDGPDRPAIRLADHLQALRDVVPFGNHVLFSSHDGVHGVEPWISDGTVVGTAMLANLRPETTLRGSVLDAETGRPVAGARLELVGANICTCTRYFGVQPDDDGRFVLEGLPDNDYSLTVTTDGFDYVTQSWPELIHAGGADVNGIDILLQRGGGISGRVVDHHGAPVKDLLLLVSAGGKEEQVYTGADGTYSTRRNLRPGTDWIVRTTDRILLREGPRETGYSTVVYNGVSCWSGCDPQRQGLPVVPKAGAMTNGIDFVVTPLGKIRGEVLDALTGRPIVTGWQGSIYANGLHGGISMAATPTGGPGEYGGAVPDGGATVTIYFRPPADYETTSLGPVFVAPGTTSPGYDIRVKPRGARLRGRVTGTQTGRPASAIGVFIQLPGGRVVSAVTGPDGRYETPPALPPGTYTVRTTPTSWASAATATVSVRGTEIAEVDLQLDHFSTVDGIVRDAVTQQPLAGVRVQVVDADGMAAGKSTLSDAAGRYSLPIGTGTYIGRAVKGGWYSDSQQVTIKGQLDAVTQADFALAPACAPSIRPAQTAFPAVGGTGRITLGPSCSACTFSSSSFIHLPLLCGTAGAVTFTVDPNPGAERTGWVVVPGGAVEIRQEGRRARSVGR